MKVSRKFPQASKRMQVLLSKTCIRLLACGTIYLLMF